nr:hypothetical protein [Tanacetum cinerariifolium]
QRERPERERAVPDSDHEPLGFANQCRWSAGTIPYGRPALKPTDAVCAQCAPRPAPSLAHFQQPLWAGKHPERAGLPPQRRPGWPHRSERQLLRLGNA